ncbi:outer membrane lipoprotein-sorting protein [Enterovibrio sp. ZSDZ42]|uniref:Outer membrane lipoprotein-sorting protein n=1 Tax=Enterovibrio gelatinilyticus TaxID=2899819 RepID=A0ABT5R2J1_9GAMM|nr:outer membrane lipoprotein-sorting protein [Enterovibrio sp. ZSDZ42]MDD1794234.1 outer membrane lipoprotein-sorting protein [Enterovibrio sp. ZSDZ42]
MEKTIPFALSALLFSSPLLFTSSLMAADNNAEKGREIAEKMDQSYSGYGTSSADGEMVLYLGNREVKRSFRSLTLEDLDNSPSEYNVLVFESPGDMRGIALLTHARTEPVDDNQWLYLPAASRTKRISSSNVSGKFVSSEFSYEDLAKQEVDEYTYQWLATEPCPNSGLTCEVIETYPKNKNSGYTKRVIWVDTEENRAQKVVFYNRHGVHEKTLLLSDYTLPDNGRWRPLTLDMENALNGRRTVMKWSNYQFGETLKKNDFKSQRLQALSR